MKAVETRLQKLKESVTPSLNLTLVVKRPLLLVRRL